MNYQQVWNSLVNQIKILNQHLATPNNPIPYPNGFVLGMNLTAYWTLAEKCINTNNPSERELFDKVIEDMINKGYIDTPKSGWIKLTQEGVTAFLL